NIKHYQ
ncbi:hypothetical protein IMS36_08095, partial [Escherichia coli]